MVSVNSTQNMKLSKSKDGLVFYIEDEGFPFGDINKAGQC